MNPPVYDGPGALIYGVLYGSHAHMTNTPASDEDWRGVFLLPNDQFLGIWQPKTTHEHKATDQVYWELGQFSRMLLKGNPNIVGMMFAPERVVHRVDEMFAPYLRDPSIYIHQRTIGAYWAWVRAELESISRAKRVTAKRLSHVPRLLWELQDAVVERRINVELEPKRLQFVMDIKTGEMDTDEAIAACGQLVIDVEDLIEQYRPGIPEPPTEKINRMLLEVREYYG